MRSLIYPFTYPSQVAHELTPSAVSAAIKACTTAFTIWYHGIFFVFDSTFELYIYIIVRIKH